MFRLLRGARPALLVLFACSAASGVDLFVSSSRGSDTNSGASPQAAWATLEHAAGASLGLRGGRILLRAGDAWQLPAPGAAGVAFGLLEGVTIGAFVDGGGDAAAAARPRLLRTSPVLSGATLVCSDCSSVFISGLEIVGGQYGVAFEFNSPAGPDGGSFGNLSVVDCSFANLRGVDYDPGSGQWWGAAVALASAVASGPVELVNVTLAHNVVALSDTLFQPFVEWPNTNPCTVTHLVVDANACVGCSYNALFLATMQVATVTRNVFLRDTPAKLFSGGTTDIIIGFLDARSSVTDNEITARGEFAGAPDGCAIDFETNSTGLLLARNYISRAWGAGVMVFGHDAPSRDLLLVNNTLVRNSCSGSVSPDRGQFAFTSPGSSGVISGNLVITCAGAPFFQDGSEPGLPLWTIEGNVLDGPGGNGSLAVAAAPVVTAAALPGGGLRVTATSPSPGTMLVYTTDGSRPERSSPPFPDAGLELPPAFRATAVFVKAYWTAPPPGAVAVESESAGGIVSPFNNASCC